MTPSYIVIHHSAVKNNGKPQAQGIENNHKTRFNYRSSLGFYTGYQYVIDTDGKLYKRRADNEPGAHCKEAEMNFKSIGVCWCMDGDKQYPTNKQQEVMAKLLSEKMAEWKIPEDNIKFHRDYAGYKSCPGTMILKELVINLIYNQDKAMKQYEQAREQANNPPKFGFVEQFDDADNKEWVINKWGGKVTRHLYKGKDFKDYVNFNIAYGKTGAIDQIPEGDPIK